MQTRSWRLSNASGFSMLEALMAMFVTLIVMASVFGLLVGGVRTSTVEFDRAEVQAQTRHALNQVKVTPGKAGGLFIGAPRRGCS